VVPQREPDLPQSKPLTNGTRSVRPDDHRRRATNGAPDVPQPRPGHENAPVPVPAKPERVPTGMDARDRLLAVLLDDPERAVHAAEELEACLRELDRLSSEMRKEHAALRDVLRRLVAAGLRREQLARLAGMPRAEIDEQLATSGH
jgi:hypothetical protein